jgi:uncharacterized protein
MRPNLTVVTLGVRDFGRALDFYKKGLGWSSSAAKKDGIAFFQLNGMVLALYDRKSLAEDGGTDPEGTGFSGITLAHNTKSEQEVDDVLGQVEKLGARISEETAQDLMGWVQRIFRRPRWTAVGGGVQPSLEDRQERKRHPPMIQENCTCLGKAPSF